MLPDTALLHRILAAGVRAPSAENVHYLRFQVRSDTVGLFSTDQGSWAEHPHRRMLALLSCGAVVENMVLRSAELGYALTTTWRPTPSLPDLFVELRWARTAAPPDPLNHAIETRHTNRRFYRRAALSAETLARLTIAANAVPEAELLWLDDPTRRALALKAIRIAETERFRRRALHGELFGAVRFELGWQGSCGEWLPPAALQVELPMRLPFALLRHWKVMRAANCLGMHLALGMRAGYLPCALAPHIGLILSGGEGTDFGNFQAGRAFQRVWLAAASEGLALQPMAATTALVRQKPGDGWVSADAKAKLQRLLAALCSGQRSVPYLLFRLGRSDAPSVVTERRPASDYIS